MGLGDGEGGGSGKGGSILWSIVWFLILWFVGFFVAGFCAGFYILLIVFLPCFPGVKVSILLQERSRYFLPWVNNDALLSLCGISFQDLTDFLLKGIQFTQYCSEKMMEGSPINVG